MIKRVLIISVLVLLYVSTFAQNAGQSYKTKAMQNVNCCDENEQDFDADNNLVKCVLEGDQQFLNENSVMIPCKSGTVVVFNNKGFLESGTLSADISLKNSAGELVNCVSGEEVSFDTNGLLMPRN